MQEERIIALEAIKKKLVGRALTYEDSYAVMNQFSKKELGDIFVAYFAAASFKEGFTDDELYFLTKAMVETGKKFDFEGIVADKHSIGGMPGTRATMIIVPIIAAAGFLIPKTSSRAITTPAGTADCMEVFAPVDIPFDKLRGIVERTGGCIVWGGHLGIAPADDIIIRVEEPLAFESFDKIMISVLAKKVAASSKLLVLDIPVGPTMKVKYVKDALAFSERFVRLARRFDITVKPEINFQFEPAGRGIGPLLEANDALRVLEQTADRPIALEDKSLKIASRLLDMCFQKSGRKDDALRVTEEILRSGKALKKFKEIIEAQGGDPSVTSTSIPLAPHKYDVLSTETGTITGVNNYNITALAKVLGAPVQKKSGMLLRTRYNAKVSKNDILFTLYSEDEGKLKEALDILPKLPVYEFKKEQ
ncbi:MAG: thymidine phosphorylase [Patescibacteria group bacterium]|jgi:AMP phosphorylase